MKKIVIIGTLHNRAEENSYLKELISRRGHQPFIVDIGYRGEPGLEADITADEVARAAGTEIKNCGIIKKERREYNQVRSHSALGYQPPAPETILSVVAT